MSENYLVFIEQPIKMDLFQIVTGKLRGKSISNGFSWEPKLNTVFHLIHKDTGMVRLSFVAYSVCEVYQRHMDRFHSSFQSCVQGKLHQVHCQAAVDLPPDQRIRGGRLLDRRYVCFRRWPGHRQLQHPEPAQVRRSSGWGKQVGLRSTSSPVREIFQLRTWFVLLRCITPCVESSHGALFCRSVWMMIRPTTRTWTTGPTAQPQLQELARKR